MKWIENYYGEWVKRGDNILIIIFKNKDKYYLEININSFTTYISLSEKCKNYDEAKMDANLKLSHFILQLMEVI